MSQRPGLAARFVGLLRGLATGWMRERESRNPKAVYEHAIAERVKQYRELKEAVAGILYLRNKLEGELADRRRELARTDDDLRRAVRRGDDDTGLALVRHKHLVREDLERAESEWRSLRGEAEEAKANLLRFRDEIRALEREKGRILASLANARARRRVQEALEGLSVDADMRALEGVREHAAQLATQGQLDRELGDAAEGLPGRLREIRLEAREEAARAELDALKRELGGRTLPAAAAPRVAVPAAGR
ncbi:MAG: PspA/IM30 family protein [Myxococcota bacterium]|nr:PspA/IM30 family protein [Myxococcota bacterium]